MLDFKAIAQAGQNIGEIGTRLVNLLESIDTHLAYIEAHLTLNSDAAMLQRGALNEFTNTPGQTGEDDTPSGTPPRP
jgi:hypothetical protein